MNELDPIKSGVQGIIEALFNKLPGLFRRKNKKIDDMVSDAANIREKEKAEFTSSKINAGNFEWFYIQTKSGSIKYHGDKLIKFIDILYQYNLATRGRSTQWVGSPANVTFHITNIGELVHEKFLESDIQPVEILEIQTEVEVELEKYRQTIINNPVNDGESGTKLLKILKEEIDIVKLNKILKFFEAEGYFEIQERHIGNSCYQTLRPFNHIKNIKI